MRPVLVPALLAALWLPPAAAGAADRPPDAVLAACQGIAALAADAGLGGVAVASGEVTDPFIRHTATGCRVTGTGKTGDFPPDAWPDAVARRELPAAGWAEDLQRGADGPDGTSFGLTRAGVLCVVSASWDGGDDADPAYVPDERYGFRAACMAAEAVR